MAINYTLEFSQVCIIEGPSISKNYIIIQQACNNIADPYVPFDVYLPIIHTYIHLGRHDSALGLGPWYVPTLGTCTYIPT
jgi:hypothetical protein